MAQAEGGGPLVLLGPAWLVVERVGAGDLGRQLESDLGLGALSLRVKSTAAAITAANTAMTTIPIAATFTTWISG